MLYNNDALAIILLCSKIGYNDENPPLTENEWFKLSIALEKAELTPADLLNFDEAECAFSLKVPENKAKRLCMRIRNSDNLLSETAALDALGVKIITQADADFPKRLIAKLKEECPPLLYYTGNIGLANAESCAVLGSRNYLECDIGFAKQISERLINNEYIIATGGGSGIDREVERFTYKHNGCVIQYCAGDIMKSMHDPFYSEQLEKRSLLMLSTVTPRAEFSLEYARRRNKLIYANSKYAFLVNATSGRVTYTGAKEALEKQLCEVYCWNNPAYKGNLELIDFGAKPVNAVVRDSK